jgi:serine/threonine protein phosphatase PrpC
MQGWRKNMEDARICDFSIKIKDKNYAVFGVFDGHGGNKLLI